MKKPMKTSELRSAVKAWIPAARVAKTGENRWSIRFESPGHLKIVEDLIKALGLQKVSHDIEGSRWDWSYVFHVTAKE